MILALFFHRCALPMKICTIARTYKTSSRAAWRGRGRASCRRKVALHSVRGFGKMTDRQPPHLTFHDLVSMVAGSAPGGTAAAHLAECGECETLLRALDQLEGVREWRITRPSEQLHAPCLSLEQIALLAAGAAGNDAPLWFDHLVACDRCGNELAAALETIHRDLSPEEEEAVKGIPAPSGDPAGRPRASQSRMSAPVNWRAWGAVGASRYSFV